MAVVATLSKGYDLDYIWKQVNHGFVKDAASYYIQASESGGEPPGRWWGPAAKALGLEHGREVEREPYELLFGEHKAEDGSPKPADPVPGPRPAPELARYEHLHAEQTGGSAALTVPATPSPALAALTAVLDRDGQQQSATQTRRHALADADHLAVLNAIWTSETTLAREQRYHDLLQAALPPGYRTEPGHQAKWLLQTLRAAELAGLDAAQVLADAIAERDLAGARDLAAVINARIRARTGSLVPLPAAKRA